MQRPRPAPRRESGNIPDRAVTCTVVPALLPAQRSGRSVAPLAAPNPALRSAKHSHPAHASPPPAPGAGAAPAGRASKRDGGRLLVEVNSDGSNKQRIVVVAGERRAAARRRRCSARQLCHVCSCWAQHSRGQRQWDVARMRGLAPLPHDSCLRVRGWHLGSASDAPTDAPQASRLLRKGNKG